MFISRGIVDYNVSSLKWHIVQKQKEKGKKYL